LYYNNPNILIFIDWFLPGFKAGGPIQSIVNLVRNLGEDYDFYIVTSNIDLGETEPYTGIVFNSWIQNGKHQVIYLDQKNQNFQIYRELLSEREYDCIYFNSMFSLNFTLKPLLLTYKFPKIKVILAPRGMLGKGALQIKKSKKLFFLNFFKFSGIPRRITWHATAETEASEIRNQFGVNSKIWIATNLSAINSKELPKKHKEENKLKVFFLSRISQKKNLRGALEYVGKVSSKYEISFTIIGPIEEEQYWLECQEQIKKLPENIHVKHLGAIPNHLLKERLKDQHFMLLPTFHENYGHVIMESWQNGCPVIISDRTPWDNLIEKNIGFDISLAEPSEFVNAIERAAAMNNLEFQKWSRASYDFAKAKTQDPASLEKYRRLFQ
jgi:glycosyltransferase involved in cell wall biosynthesis